MAAMLLTSCLASSPAAPNPSIARIWDEEILAAIRIDTPHPPVQARNLFGLSVAMYDAWAAYDPVAVGYLYRGKHAAVDTAAARREAISFAAYQLLKERYALSRSAPTTMTALDNRLLSLGYNTNRTAMEISSPAAVGRAVAGTLSEWFATDGSRQAAAYADLGIAEGGYSAINPPLFVANPGIAVVDVNRWQPLSIENSLDQHGFPVAQLQKFLGPQWLSVRPFALTRSDSSLPWIMLRAPPKLGGETDAEFRSNVVEVIRRSSELSPDDGVFMDISPGAFGNNTLGNNDGIGHAANPVTGLAYASNRVRRGDFARVLAEFWADGPSSETPPGHWNSLANNITDHALFAKRIGATGPRLDALEWDVKLYFALNAALHDAACAAWSIKRYYDGWRPITAIRYMGHLGQSSDPQGASFHTNGLPLIPGLIELSTTSSTQAGERHAGFAAGKVLVRSWPGQPVDPSAQHSGVRWIAATHWVPYQRKTFVTPAFPGYISGHSTFSHAAAEVLASITGSPFFPGGLASHTAVARRGLTFELGPSETIELQWATYYDAADQAGLSRIWGGIHPPADDLPGRRVGAECGRRAWALAQRYFDGSIANSSVALEIHPLNTGQFQVRLKTFRGLYYKWQATSSMGEPFTDDPFGFIRAVDSETIFTDTTAGSKQFYRVVQTVAP